MKHLLQHFTRLSLHPKNAKELKGLILQLAVQGKLTAKWREEHSEVENASVLLERIKKEKAQLVAAKKIKKEKPLPEIAEEEIPYELQEGWVWCRLGNLGLINPRNKIDDSTEIGFVPMKSISANYDVLPLYEKRNWGSVKKSFTHFQENDVAFAKITPCFENSKACIFKGAPNGFGAGTTELHVFRSINKKLTPGFIYNIFKSPSFLDGGENKMTGSAGQKRVPKDYFINYIIGLPPYEEQKAIVKTVHQLFAEVEQLETLTKARIQLKEDFVTSALHQLSTGDTATEWAFLQKHFHTFFTEKSNIKKLRESILQLAVQGKLTRQWRTDNPNVEDASVLLERIKEEKAQLIAAKKIRKEKPLPEIMEEEIPYELPEGWVWCRMLELCQFITDGTHQTPKYTEEGRMFLSAKNVKPFQFMPEKHRFVSQEDFEGYRRNRKPERNDILLTRVGAGIGEAALIDQDIEFAIYVSVALLKMFPGLLYPQYIVIWLNSPEGRQYSSKNTYGKGVSQGNLNLSLIRGFVVSLPPFKEQKAIVEAVNAIMSLCDQLEQAIQNSKSTQEDWMKSSLREVFETEPATIPM